MADSWEDEDFDTPSIPLAAPTSWEDEEEEDEAPKVAAAGVAPKMSAAAAARKAAETDAKLAAEVEMRLQANETAEERRMRERNQVEEADNALTEHLFGGKAGGARGGLAGIKLTSMPDHMKLGLQLGELLHTSKPAHILCVLKEVISKVEGQLSEFDMAELTSQCRKLQESKEAATASKAKAKAHTQQVLGAQKATKKKAAKKKKAHHDIFGDVDGDAIDNMGLDYEEAYDDFM